MPNQEIVKTYETIVGRAREDLEKFGSTASGFIGKHIVGTGEEAHLTTPVKIDLLRPHVILVSGKRGCIPGDNLIFTEKGYKHIKDYDGEKVLSLNLESLKFEWKKAQLLKYKINEKLIRFELEDGKEISVTREHPLLVFHNDVALLWKKAADIHPNEKLIVVTNLPEIQNDKTRMQDKEFWGRRKLKTIYLNENLACRKITKIEKIDWADDVYDLIVDDNNSFICEGIISHNSGKSYSAAVILEEFLSLPEEFKQKMAFLVFDPVGIYWSMKLSNKQQAELLREWKLEPKGFLQAKVYVPLELKQAYENAGIPVDYAISISPREFSPDDWSLAFNFERTSEFAVNLERKINAMLEEGEDFDIDDIIMRIRDDAQISQHTKNVLSSYFEVAKAWGIFSKKGMKIDDIVKAGEVSIIDLSRVKGEEWGVRNLLAAWITRQVYKERVIARKEEELAKIEGREVKKVFPLTWLVFEEAHGFVPSDRETVSSEPIKLIAKQGREPGVGLVVITQMPAKIHQDVLSQCDIIISFRLTSKDDLQALHSVHQVYLAEELEKYINKLPRQPGACIVLDDVIEKIFTVNIRPRISWHSGATAQIL